MKFKVYKSIILSDLFRISADTSMTVFIRHLFFGESYKYIFWMRTCSFAKASIIYKYTLYPFARIILKHYVYKLGISIPYKTNIGKGFYIGHFGGVVINSGATIGVNCNISQCVTIGRAGRGGAKGFPVIGNNVYLGPGAKIIGGIKIGNDVVIGANSVVTKDVPDKAVVVGIPGKVISFDGSDGIVNNIDYME
jgi:serine O-acetyltransferase